MRRGSGDPVPPLGVPLRRQGVLLLRFGQVAAAIRDRRFCQCHFCTFQQHAAQATALCAAISLATSVIAARRLRVQRNDAASVAAVTAAAAAAVTVRKVNRRRNMCAVAAAAVAVASGYQVPVCVRVHVCEWRQGPAVASAPQAAPIGTVGGWGGGGGGGGWGATAVG